MSSLSYLGAESQAKRKQTRREKFLAEMEALLPWTGMEKPIRRYYSKSLRGRKPYPLSTMLRIHCMQLFYNLSDPGMEDSLYEIASMRQFAGITIDTVPDETTILNLRHLLEEHQLGQKIFDRMNTTLTKTRTDLQRRHHYGCHDHCDTYLHQQPGQRSRPGDPPGQER
ncbi:transposase [Gynuella sp.]|uniref:transposase n=1 Tax=Gynuella sp. TaxID=2969146 RepID=UPI003D0DD616